jgi:hypothetical protein
VQRRRHDEDFSVLRELNTISPMTTFLPAVTPGQTIVEFFTVSCARLAVVCKRFAQDGPPEAYRRDGITTPDWR